MNTKESKHLDLQFRNFIEQGLKNNSTKTEIAKVIDMDNSSVCKEVKKHSFDVKFSRQGMSTIGTYDCQNIALCGYNAFCKSECPKRILIACKLRDKTIYNWIELGAFASFGLINISLRSKVGRKMKKKRPNQIQKT